MKKLISIICLLFMVSSTSFALDITKDYSAQALNEYIDDLSDTYDEIDVEILGNSYLGKPIKVIQLKNISTQYNKDTRYTQGIDHFLVIGGIHGRERVNPKLLVKQIEYYAKNKLIPENMVIHYIPLANPDGYDLSLFEGIATDYLADIADENYPRWKSNIRGVDLNRNFPDIYLALDEMTWINQWGRVDNHRYYSDEPSGEFYFGSFAGSEIETQLLMDYMNRYKYEMFLDYHSQGEVLFINKWFMPNAYNEKNSALAEIIKGLNGYFVPKDNGEYSSGFTTNYMANRHRIPSITIETTRTTNLPYLRDDEEIKAYEENKDVTIKVFKKAAELKSFGNFKTYDVDGNFFDDYHDEAIAHAYAKRYNLKVKIYEGEPLQHLDDFVSAWAVQSIKELISLSVLNIDLSKGYQSHISVEDFLDSLERINKVRYEEYEQPDIVKMLSKQEKMNRIQASYILYTYLDGENYSIKPIDFKDIGSLVEKYKKAIYFVNRIGLIKGYSEHEFKPLNPLTKEEAAIILLRLFRMEDKGVLKDE